MILSKYSRETKNKNTIFRFIYCFLFFSNPNQFHHIGLFDDLVREYIWLLWKCKIKHFTKLHYYITRLSTYVYWVTDASSHEHNFRANFDLTCIQCLNVRRTNAQTCPSRHDVLILLHVLKCVKNTRKIYTMPVVSIREYFRLDNRVEEQILNIISNSNFDWYTSTSLNAF